MLWINVPSGMSFRKGRSRSPGGIGTGKDFLTNLQTYRRYDVTLVTVLVIHKSDTGRTVRIVFNGLDRAFDTVVIALEIDQTVHLAMTATDVAHGHLTVAVTATGTLDAYNQ